MTIVVGIDDTEASQSALDWAAERTGCFGPIRPVRAWDYPVSAWTPGTLGGGVVPPVEEFTDHALAAVETRMAALDAEVPRTPPVIGHGDAGAVLVAAADDADLLVVGTRGRGPVRANVIGSVARHCADHTPIPLVIVPHVEHPAPAGPSEQIVVGVDDSAHARAALRWAATHAAPSAMITAVSAWQTPIDGPIMYGADRFDLRALRAAVAASVNEVADEVCDELGADHSRVLREVAEGDPRSVLLARSDEADLLVLGQRGRSGLAHFFLGSTTTALIHRPHCPTAVIPA